MLMRSTSSKIPLDRGPGPDVGVAGPTDDLSSLIPQVLVVLPMIPMILAVANDIRSRLSGLRKSHLTIEEVAAATGRAPYTVRAWCKQGRIRAIRVADSGPKGRLLVPREELEKLLATGLASQLPAAAID
jgi:excisionase family DNA binding protein